MSLIFGSTRAGSNTLTTRPLQRHPPNYSSRAKTGTPFRHGNYLKPHLKPLARRAGIADMTYQALRRTCATHFQKHGKLRDIQAQLRHSKLEMTARYVKEIPEQVRAAVDSMDRELCYVTEKEARPL